MYRTFQRISAYTSRENIISDVSLHSRITLKVGVWTCKINYSPGHNYAENKYTSDRQTFPATYKKFSMPAHIKYQECIVYVSQSIIFSAFQNFLSYYFYVTPNL
jgi:hypothetical protein